MRGEVNPSAANETVLLHEEREIPRPAREAIGLLLLVYKEKVAVSEAIHGALARMPAGMNAMIEANRVRKQASEALELLLRYGKPKRIVTQGSGYMLNAEGNQVPYRYDIRVEREPDFDPETIRLERKRLLEEAARASAEIERLMLDTQVWHEPAFDVNEAPAFILENYAVSAGGEG